ncbi:MAG: hypothetical protein AAGJ52_02860 [Pseudomonadota bacterium]
MVRGRYIFKATSADRSKLWPVMLVLGGIWLTLGVVFVTRDGDMDWPAMLWFIIPLCVASGLVNLLWARYPQLLFRGGFVLRIDKNSICLYPRAGLLTRDRDLGDPLEVIRREDVLRVEQIHEARLPKDSKFFSPRLDYWAAEVILANRRIRLSSLDWQPDINTVSQLHANHESGMDLGDVLLAPSQIIGPIDALRRAGYPIVAQPGEL